MTARFLHILLAFITLLSSTGFVLNNHVCLGNPEGIEMCKSVDSCEGDENVSCVESDHDCDKNCCTNHGQYLQLKQDQQSPTHSVQLPSPPVSAVVVLVVPAELCPGTTQLWPSYLSFKPPIVEPDIWLQLENIRC